VAATCSPAQARKYAKEVHKCRKSFVYFADTYCHILQDDGAGGAWVRFRLWPEQRRTARILQNRRLVAVLKARQLGLTWLVLAFVLWLVLFHPIATVLLFSRRDDEAVDMLRTRLRGMYDRLPAWLKVRGFQTDNDHEWHLSNNSRVLAFPTTAGDSYTASLAVVDEADLVPDLARLLRSVKPTIDAGGRMILLSRADKTRPESPFKRIYTSAKEGTNGWAPVFLPWHARPGRDAQWYAAQQADILSRTGALDDLHEQYPATDAEALAPRQLDKRIPSNWLTQCYEEGKPIDPAGNYPPAYRLPALPALVVYVRPQPGRTYVVGADPAEGNPTSHDSALELLDAQSGEEVAALAGKLEPSVFADYAAQLARWYNNAPILVERNNHGHAVLLWLRHFAADVTLLCGRDGQEGWMSSVRGKTTLYDACADAFQNREVLLHSFTTFTQLASIDGNKLRAPEGLPDDRADAFALACAARLQAPAASDDYYEEPILASPGFQHMGGGW
jgi:hypothetical protein